MEYLWLRKDYTMPWLWSMHEVIHKIKKLNNLEIRLGGEPLTYYPNSTTTAYNCEKCTGRIWKRIRQYNETHDLKLLETYCDCTENWIEKIKDIDEAGQKISEARIAQRVIDISKNLSFEDYLEKKSNHLLLDVI